MSGLDIRQGDTLRILSADGTDIVVEVRRQERGAVSMCDAVTDWLRSARGSVKSASESPESDLRMAYYAEKYGLNQ